jgi:TolA-binding protein
MVGTVRRALLCAALFSSLALSQDEGLRSETRDYQVAYGLFHDGQYHLAYEELTRFLKNHPASARCQDVSYLVGETLMNMGRGAAATEAFEAFLKSYPRSHLVPDALFRLGEISLNAKKYDLAIRRYREVLEKFPDRDLAGEAAYWIGESYYQRKAYQEALEYYRMSSERYPKNRVADYALYSVGWTLEQEKEYQKAEAVYRTFTAKFPQSTLYSAAEVRVGSVLLDEGKPKEAIQALENAQAKVKTDDARGEAEYLIAEAYDRIGENAEALRHYQQVVKAYPGHRLERDARYGIGWIYLEEKNYPEAEKAFESISTGSDELADAALLRSAQAMRLEGRKEEAARVLENLLSRSPKGTYADNALLELGTAAFEKKQYGRARELLHRLIANFPGSDVLGEAYRMTGESYLAEKEYEKAHAAFVSAAGVSTSPQAVVSDALYQSGWSLFKLNRFTDAAGAFEELLKRFPQHPRADEAAFWLAESEYKADRFRAAFDDYDRLISEHPSSSKVPDALYGKAWSAYKLGDYRSAAQLFASVAERYPRSSFASDARVRKGDSYFAMKDFGKAAASYREALGEAGKAGDYVTYQLAQSNIRGGAVDKGIDLYRELIQKFPHSELTDDARFGIAWAYFQKKEYPRAVEEFKKLVTEHPQSTLAPRSLLSVGDALYNQKEYAEALSAYRELLDRYPKSKEVADALSGVQYCYGMMGKERESAGVIEQFVHANPSSPLAESLLLKKGEILSSRGDREGSIASYRELIQRYPKSDLVPEAKYRIACALAEQNRPEAIRLLKEITAERSAVAPRAMVELGRLLSGEGRTGEAIEEFERVEKSFPDDSSAIRAGYEKGLAERRAGRADDALRQFASVGASHPGSEYGDRSLLEAGILRLASGDYAKAAEEFTEVATRHSDELGAEAQYYMGETHFRREEYKKAITTLVRVKYLFPSAAEWVVRASMKIGESYEKLGERAKAREAYQSAMRLATGDLQKEAERRLKLLE